LSPGLVPPSRFSLFFLETAVQFPHVLNFRCMGVHPAPRSYEGASSFPPECLGLSPFKLAVKIFASRNCCMPLDSEMWDVLEALPFPWSSLSHCAPLLTRSLHALSK